MRNISHFINVLFFALFFSNLLFSQDEKIKNIQIFGSNINNTKSIFFKDEIINVSFDELSHKTNSYSVSNCSRDVAGIAGDPEVILYISTSIYLSLICSAASAEIFLVFT